MSSRGRPSCARTAACSSSVAIASASRPAQPTTNSASRTSSRVSPVPRGSITPSVKKTSASPLERVRVDNAAVGRLGRHGVGDSAQHRLELLAGSAVLAVPGRSRRPVATYPVLAAAAEMRGCDRDRPAGRQTPSPTPPGRGSVAPFAVASPAGASTLRYNPSACRPQNGNRTASSACAPATALR
jgi:hypothetical protein